MIDIFPVIFSRVYTARKCTNDRVRCNRQGVKSWNILPGVKYLGFWPRFSWPPDQSVSSLTVAIQPQISFAHVERETKILFKDETQTLSMKSLTAGY